MGYRQPVYVVVELHASSSDPADSSTYYFGNPITVLSATATARKTYFPINGTVRHCEMCIACDNAPTAEDTTWVLRLNDTTDYPIKVGAVVNAVNYTITGLNIPINPGDFFNIKLSTPAWVTNPTGMRQHFALYVEI